MSIAVGLNAGRYVLLAADCRGLRYIDDTMTKETAFEYYTDKIEHTKFGFVTGCGIAGLLYDITERMTSAQTLDDVLDAVTGARQVYESQRDSAVKSHALMMTGLMLTRAVRGRVEVLVFHPSIGPNELSRIPVGQACPFIPADSDGRYWEALRGTVRVCGSSDDLRASLAYHAALLRALIEQYAADPQSEAGAECTLAAHVDDGRRLLTDILSPAEPLAWIDVPTTVGLRT